MALDPVTILAGLSFVLVLAGVLQHFYDRYAKKGFYKASRDVAIDNGKAIRLAVEGLRNDLRAENVSEQLPDFTALQATFTELPNNIRAALPVLPDLTTLPAAIQTAVANGIVEASTRVMQAQVRGLEGPEAEGIQAMGTDAAAEKKLTRSLKTAVGADMIGPYGAILAEYAPSVYAWLTEHPESVQWALSQPWLQGIIKAAQAKFNEISGGIRSGGGSYWEGKP